MKFITFICAFLMLCNVKGLAQQSINSYKYVIVPRSFSFLNEADQYQLNSLTKFLFEKHGFKALMQDETFPEDLQSNRCLALTADVEKHKSVFNTKLQVHLTNCTNVVVYTSDEGESREKMFDKAYNLALRDAFKSIQKLNYSYQADQKLVATSSSPVSDKVSDTRAQEEIDRLKQEVASLKKQHDQKPDLNAAQKEVVVLVEQEAKEELQEVIKEGKKSNELLETLFANPVENGYTITDASSKVLYNLVFSGKEDVYIVKGQDAILYKMNNTWIVSTASNSGVSMTTLNVKFN